MCLSSFSSCQSLFFTSGLKPRSKSALARLPFVYGRSLSCGVNSKCMDLAAQLPQKQELGISKPAECRRFPPGHPIILLKSN